MLPPWVEATVYETAQMIEHFTYVSLWFSQQPSEVQNNVSILPVITEV